MADAVAEQIAALKDEDWAIREEAATILGTLRDPRAVVPLVSVLRDGDRAVRDAATGALLAIGEPAMTTLGVCLADPVLTVQELASSVLATIADARVLPPLIKALKSPDWIVRMHAAKALGRIQDSGSVAPLVPLLQDKVKAVREETSTALAAIGEAALASLLDALTHTEWLVRLHAVEALGKTRSPEAVDPLLSVLFNDRDRAVREDAVRALGQIGDVRAVEFLVTTMKTPGLRPLAVEALGRIGDRSAVSVLITVLERVDQPEAAQPIDGCGDQWDEERFTL
ncbi:MAG: HEAT repeat domain-containing protein, partial [Planctomycetota bacterium]